MQTNQRVAGIPTSSTIALDTRAKELIASGANVINMAVGEPDFPAPAAARRAASEKVMSGTVRYTPAPGTKSLRAAVARYLSETRGAPFEWDNVTICHSAKHALSGALLSLVEPGDEVMLLLPAWVSYVEQVRFAGGIPVGVEPGEGCRPDLERLRAAITPRTKGMMINSPSNPTGYTYTHDEVRQIAEIAVEHDLWIISDEIYQRLIYEGEPNLSPTSLGEKFRERTIIVDGASKTYAMTGYRIGFLAGPKELVASVGRLHSQLTGSPNAVSQDAYEAVLDEEPPEVAAMVAEFDRRRRSLLAGLHALDLEVPVPRGAFYAFPNVARYLDERGSIGFCEDLLEKEGVAIVPGSAFGMDEHVRLSYALSLDRIEEALTRLRRFLDSLGG